MITLIIAYLLVILVLYGTHERIVFQPDKLPEDYQFHFEHPFFELVLQDDNSGMALHALHFPVRAAPRGIVLYFHGNSNNLQRWGKYAIDFTQHGFEVLAVDYPGYGKSKGKANEQALYRSAALMLEWAVERFPPDQIIIYGRSLGSGPATWLAAQNKVQQLILETPFPSIPQLFRMRVSVVLVPFTPRPEFPVAEHLQAVSYPVSIFQGTDDWVVPYRVAIRLKPFLKTGDKFFTVIGGGHKNLRDFQEYQENLADLLR